MNTLIVTPHHCLPRFWWVRDASGRSVGTVADGAGGLHAVDYTLRVHYASTLDACVAWLAGRAS